MSLLGAGMGQNKVRNTKLFMTLFPKAWVLGGLERKVVTNRFRDKEKEVGLSTSNGR